MNPAPGDAASTSASVATGGGALPSLQPASGIEPSAGMNSSPSACVESRQTHGEAHRVSPPGGGRGGWVGWGGARCGGPGDRVPGKRPPQPWPMASRRVAARFGRRAHLLICPLERCRVGAQPDCAARPARERPTRLRVVEQARLEVHPRATTDEAALALAAAAPPQQPPTPTADAASRRAAGALRPPARPPARPVAAGAAARPSCCGTRAQRRRRARLLVRISEPYFST